MQSLLEGVSNADSSKVDRLAMRAAREEQLVVDQFINLPVSFRGTAHGGNAAAPERQRGATYVGRRALVPAGSARFLSGFDLFRGPEVGLGDFNVLFGARNLALVSLQQSLVHT